MKDDLDNCRGKVTACFSYIFNADETDLFRQEVKDVSLYIFGEHDVLLTSILVDVASLGPTNQYTILLDKGQYRIIALGNPEEAFYRVRESGSASKAAVSLIPGPDGEVNGTLPDLFYGAARISVTNNTNTAIDLPMVKNTNNIQVLIPAQAGTRTIPGTGYSVRITGSNGAIDFENNTVNTPIIYKPGYSQTIRDNAIYDLARFKTFKLSLHDDMTIELYRQGATVRKDGLVDILLAEFPHIRTDEDLLRYSDYEFVYGLDERGELVLTSLTAGPWSKQLGQQGGI